MKSLLWFAVIGLWIGSAGMVLAQNSSEGGWSNGGGRHRGVKLGPLAQQVHQRMRGQFKLIIEGQKSGKLTSNAIDGLKDTLKSVREQESTFIKQNGTNDLTSDQAAQLNQLLDKNSSALGETTSTTPTFGSPTPSH